MIFKQPEFDIDKFVKAHEKSDGADVDIDIYDGNALLARETISNLYKELNI